MSIREEEIWTLTQGEGHGRTVTQAQHVHDRVDVEAEPGMPGPSDTRRTRMGAIL